MTFPQANTQQMANQDMSFFSPIPALPLPFGTFSSVQSLSCVQLFVTPWTATHQAFLSITNSWSLLKLMSIKSVMLSNHLILCHPLVLLPANFSRIRVFSNESVLCIRWPKYWSFSSSISPSPGRLLPGKPKVFHPIRGS